MDLTGGALRCALTDTHAHLDFPAFDTDRIEVIRQMRANGIQRLILPGVEPAQWPRMLQVAEQFQFPYALGIHPWYLPDNELEAISELRSCLLQHQQGASLVALGECGLDKRRAKQMALNGDETHWQRQQSLFASQLQLANQFALPTIIHSVQCHTDTLVMLQQFSIVRGGVIHGFSGSFEVALQYWQLGFRLGVGGLLLNPAAKKLRNAVTKLPLSALLVETDSPDMLPVNVTDSRNTPLTLVAVVEEIARLRQISVVQLSEQLEDNCCQLFEL